MATHIIQFPSGRFGFVGVVPFALKFAADRITPAEVRACMSDTIARQLAEGRGGYLRLLTWATRDEALRYARARGFPVVNR